MSAKDTVIPFVFEELPVRGALIRLDDVWQRLQAGHNYPQPIEEILGHAAAATALIAQSLKFDGSVTLQIISDGPFGMLVMQCTDDLDMRGMTTAREVTGAHRFGDLVGNARCAVTIDAGAMDRPYQGIVEIRPESLAASLENYFARSVQVPSCLKLQSARSHCGGILLQQMPGEAAIDADDWRRLSFLVATLRPDDLIAGSAADLLHRLFAEDDLRLFTARSLRFRCRCSTERVEAVLRLLGERETREALDEQGRVDVTCEYCGHRRSFDSVDIARLFAGQTADFSASLH